MWLNLNEARQSVISQFLLKPSASAEGTLLFHLVLVKVCCLFPVDLLTPAAPLSHQQLLHLTAYRIFLHMDFIAHTLRYQKSR